MSALNQNKPSETIQQPVFYLRGVLHLPHYSTKHMWVGPGRNSTAISTTSLVEQGARLSVMSLWERYWTKEVKGWKQL
jgi:hypothetical protein